MKVRVALGIGAVLAIALAGAGGYALGRRAVPATPLAGASGGEVVARFDGHALTLRDLEAQIDSQPAAIRERLAVADERKEFVDELVRTLVLANRAEAKGYHRDAAFVRRYAQELANLLVEKDVEAPERARPPTDDEVRAYFAEHEKDLNRPERVRLAVIGFDAPDAAAKAKKRGAAQAALTSALASASDHYAFGNLARLRSEDPRTRGTNGEIPPMSREDLSAAFGPELAAAAFELTQAGAVLPRVVEGERALHLVKLVAREPAAHPTLEDVKDLLRQRLAAERRQQRFKQFMEETMRSAGVSIDERAIAGMRVGGRAASAAR
jgi:parvulin-like peptidyl-prolyl isomerase